MRPNVLHAPAIAGAFVLALAGAAGAQTATPPPMPLAAFEAAAQVQPGLIPIARKDGNVYLILSKSQLGSDFIATSVPATGLGGLGPAAGEPYVAPARIIHFDRVDNRVVLRWPNTIATTPANSPESNAAQQSLPSSVIAVTPIVAEDPATGTVAISAAPFLGDVADYQANFRGPFNPMRGYILDAQRTFFTQAKALPQNDVLRVSQTWANGTPTLGDNAPDARSLEVQMSYNLIAAPHDGYVPRIADPRVGYFEQPLLDFGSDRNETRNLYYVSRWNFQPKAPGRPSEAANPIAYYIASDVPTEYRDTIKRALLTWNDAFARVGILNAIQVEEQPSDPTWDPDDIRHNMVRWVDTTYPQYGAEALLVTDPRTGEEINTGINVDAIEGLARNSYKFVVAPARQLADSDALENAFVQEAIRATVLHESGHDFGLQHNFIGSMAYSARELQSRAFTQRNGVATSVMEYAPLNVWPAKTGQGDYVQTVLGPYDYYAIRYGYGYVPGATTPQSELPTLKRWASSWTNPLYRFASDEDTNFAGGHAIDPRVQVFDLTNDPLAWCADQLQLYHGLMNAVDRRFPLEGNAFDEARRAFLTPLRQYTRCAVMPAHTIGGEYLSRADAGDPGAGSPLQPVPRAVERRAWGMLSTGLFSDAAWHFSPNVLDKLIYSEVSAFSGGSWAYDPAARHDVPVVQLAAAAQDSALAEMFAPITLQRIDDLSTRYAAGSTMTLSDLFDWSRESILSNLAGQSGVVRRSLQVRFAKRLADLWLSPDRGTPSDAQAMARHQLVYLESATAAALNSGRLDELTQAHLEALNAIAKQALEARATVFGGTTTTIQI